MPPLNTFSRTCLALAIGHAMSAPSSAATIIVNDKGDQSIDGDLKCTLREAVLSANGSLGSEGNGCALGSMNEDTIVFAQDFEDYGGRISLTQPSTLRITSDLVIDAPPSASVIIDGMGNAGVFYADLTRVTLNNLTITGGSGSGGISAYASRVDLNNSTVSGNSASSGGGIDGYDSVIVLSNSTVSGNSAGSGGGIYTTGGVGGPGVLTLNNSTVTGNSGDRQGGGIKIGYSNVSLTNSIVAGNFSVIGAEIHQSGTMSTFTTGNNLFGDSSQTNAQAFINFTPSSTDITATSDGTLATALSSILAPLSNDGGATKTHALVSGSPAIDAGNNMACAESPINNFDQRRKERPIGSACDIGSYEFEPESTSSYSSFFVVPLPNGKAATFSL